MFDTFNQIPLDERWRGQQHPIPIVIAMIRDHDLDGDDPGGKFLLIRRNRAPYYNSWALVGGKWDFGESLAQAIYREVREETGLLTRFISLQGIVSERLAPAKEDTGKAAHFLILVCLLEVVSGDAQEQNEGEVRWFSPIEIETLNRQGNIIPSDYRMLKQFYQADPVPFYEVDMTSAQSGNTGLEQSNLLRFERLSNHAPPSS